MNYYLLDGVGGAFLLLLFGAGLLFVLTAVFIEAFIMYRMKFTANFKRALLISFVANILSMAAGLILSNADPELFHLQNIKGFAVFFAVTVVIEFAVLYLINKEKPVKQTFQVCALMNLVSYALAALFILVIFNG